MEEVHISSSILDRVSAALNKIKKLKETEILQFHPLLFFYVLLFLVFSPIRSFISYTHCSYNYPPNYAFCILYRSKTLVPLATHHFSAFSSVKCLRLHPNPHICKENDTSLCRLDSTLILPEANSLEFVPSIIW